MPSIWPGAASEYASTPRADATSRRVWITVYVFGVLLGGYPCAAASAT